MHAHKQFLEAFKKEALTERRASPLAALNVSTLLCLCSIWQAVPAVRCMHAAWLRATWCCLQHGFGGYHSIG